LEGWGEDSPLLDGAHYVLDGTVELFLFFIALIMASKHLATQEVIYLVVFILMFTESGTKLDLGLMARVGVFERLWSLMTQL
jgi:hypothetical protein